MKRSLEKAAALLGSGLLALTLSACGADDDTSPVPEEPDEEQFDTFEDEDGSPTTPEGEEPDNGGGGY